MQKDGPELSCTHTRTHRHTHSHVQETIDGDLASRVFGVLAVADEGFHTQRCVFVCALLDQQCLSIHVAPSSEVDR
eukprot:scaffold4747_cov17-Tisochrysis_lutea.AAC.1